MNVWMICYKGASGQWLLSNDFPIRGRTRKAVRVFMKPFMDVFKDGNYKIVKFTAKMPNGRKK